MRTVRPAPLIWRLRIEDGALDRLAERPVFIATRPSLPPYYTPGRFLDTLLVLPLASIALTPLFREASIMTAVVVTLIVVGLILLIPIALAVGIYNRLVTLKNRFQNAFAQIEVQLKRRYDLIPNLVETAKGYMKHERETLDAVISARNQAATGLQQAASDPGNAEAIRNLVGAEGALTGAMGRLFAVMEAYPDLKANENMKQLSEELTSTENKVAFSRQAFNDAVTAYNTYRQTFPAVLFAGTLGHGQNATLLEFEDSQAIQEAPKVEF
jgi:LemA protein